MRTNQWRSHRAGFIEPLRGLGHSYNIYKKKRERENNKKGKKERKKSNEKRRTIDDLCRRGAQGWRGRRLADFHPASGERENDIAIQQRKQKRVEISGR